MENSLYALEMFARASQDVLAKVKADIEAIKSQMTPEQRKEFEKEMGKHDVDGAENDLKSALDKYRDTLTRL